MIRFRLKCTPVPVSRNTGCNLRAAREHVTVGWSHANGRCWCISLDVRGGGTRDLAVVAAVPDLELLEAVVASASGSSTWVKLGVLVEGNEKSRVPIAEDVSTLAAVVPTSEVAERALAGRVIANRRLNIGLPVLPTRRRGDLRKQLEVEVAVEATSVAVTSGGAGETVTKNRHSGDVHEAAVGASKRQVRVGARSRYRVFGFWLHGLGGE